MKTADQTFEALRAPAAQVSAAAAQVSAVTGHGQDDARDVTAVTDDDVAAFRYRGSGRGRGNGRPGRGRGQSRGGRQGRGGNRQQQQQPANLCPIHKQHGNKAYFCAGPEYCPWKDRVTPKQQ